MLKFMYLNSQQQANIVIKNDLFQYGFVRTELTAMYSERPKNFKESRLQEKFWVAAFLTRNICLKTIVFLISQNS